MRYFKFWLMLISISLIFIDKFSFINSLRDSAIIFVQKHTQIMLYRVKNYPQLVLLHFQTQKELTEQNANLKKQLEKYSSLLTQSKNKVADLSAITQLKKNTPNGFTQILAEAILDVNFFVNDQLLINVGAEDGVKVGQAVINSDGVIGQIGSVNKNSAQVFLITNPNLKFYLEDAKTKNKMLAQGNGSGYLSVRFIDKKIALKVGDILETTGLDSIYPANIAVARIIKIFYENSGFNSALCEPVVDFHKLKYVLVLKNADN